MSFRFSVTRAGWTWLTVPILYVLGLIGAAIAERVIDDTATDAKVTLSVVALASWILGNWLALFGWVAFIALVVAAFDGWRTDRRTDARRTLAYAHMYLSALRDEVLRPTATDIEIHAAIDRADKMIGALINLTPKIFTQATASEFGALHSERFGVDAVTSAAGLSHENVRRFGVAFIEQFMDTVHRKWTLYPSNNSEPLDWFKQI